MSVHERAQLAGMVIHSEGRGCRAGAGGSVCVSGRDVHSGMNNLASPPRLSLADYSPVQLISSGEAAHLPVCSDDNFMDTAHPCNINPAPSFAQIID